MEQHLHSMHCHLYLRTETIMFAVNCKHVGWPTTRIRKKTTGHRKDKTMWISAGRGADEGRESKREYYERKGCPGHLSRAEEQ